MHSCVGCAYLEWCILSSTALWWKWADELHDVCMPSGGIIWVKACNILGIFCSPMHPQEDVRPGGLKFPAKIYPLCRDVSTLKIWFHLVQWFDTKWIHKCTHTLL